MKPSLGEITIDGPKLLETRMLIQSNSGGGKSHALRRVLEQTATGVQQIVIDVEGEFSSLRERFDYIICAPSGGDAVATPATAAALARAVWESGVSAIVDIYDLKAHDRIAFVGRFLYALINAPKKIWHPTLVAIDEVHIFAPQVGQAESLGAVTDLATRGRKRGLALLGATQRISKLHKDVAAECLNKLIGRTGLDIDVVRAADELGMSKADSRVLRDLEPGEFFVFGPALTRQVTRTRIGAVLTTHPKVGQRMMAAPPPASPALLTKLAKLDGLQRKAVDEVRTVETLTAEVTTLRRQLAASAKPAPAGVPEAEVQRRIREALAAAPSAGAVASKAMVVAVEKIAAGLQAVQAELAGVAPVMVPRARTVVVEARGKTASNVVAKPEAGPVSDGVSGPQQRILDTLASLYMFGISAPSKQMTAAHAGVPHTSGGYRNNLSALRTAGLIEYPQPGTVAMTDAGRAKANYPAKAPSLSDLHDAWLRLVSRPQADILGLLISAYPGAMSKDELASAAGVPSTSGGYRNNLSHLRTLGAIDYPQAGSARASDLLFPKGKP